MKVFAFVLLIIFVALIGYFCVKHKIERGMVLAVIVANLFAIYAHLNTLSPGKDEPGIFQRVYDWFAEPEWGPDRGPQNEAGEGEFDLTATRGQDVTTPNPAAAAEAEEPDDLQHIYGPQERTAPERLDAGGPLVAGGLRAYQQFNGGYDRTAKRVGAALAAADATARGLTDADDHLARHGILRNRARDAEQGAAATTLDWYRYHYGDEFAIAEASKWWGRNDVAPVV